MQSEVQLFVMIGQYTHKRLAQNFVHSRSRVEAWVRRYDEPFIARLYVPTEKRFEQQKAGELRMWLTYEQWLEE